MKDSGVILYSTSLHAWEVWQQGRPVGHGSLGSCERAYPEALKPSQTQHDLAEQDQDR